MRSFWKKAMVAVVTMPAAFLLMTVLPFTDGVLRAYAEVVRDDVNAFFRANGFDLKKVTLARIGKILMDTGLVNDYEGLTLNGKSASVHISDEQLPVCGVVSLNVIS